MAEDPYRVSDPTLAELLRRLVPAYRPERVYLFGSAADSASSTLPIQKVFLPLLHGMVYDLAEVRERRAEYQVGGTAVLAFPEAGRQLTVRVTSPDGKARLFFVRDPEGNLLEMVQMLA